MTKLTGLQYKDIQKRYDNAPKLNVNQFYLQKFMKSKAKESAKTKPQKLTKEQSNDRRPVLYENTKRVSTELSVQAIVDHPLDSLPSSVSVSSSIERELQTYDDVVSLETESTNESLEDHIKSVDSTIPQIDPNHLCSSLVYHASGSTAVVYRGKIFIGGEEVVVAVKKLVYNKRAVQEVMWNQKLENIPCMARYYCSFYHEGKLYICSEFMNYTLADLIDKRRRKPSNSEIISVAFQMVYGLNELHKRGIMHRDIKPNNIFVNGNKIYYGDFGFTSYIVKGKKLCDLVGTPAYMSYEVFQRSYGMEADIWSLGITLLEFAEPKNKFFKYFDRKHSLDDIAEYIRISKPKLENERRFTHNFVDFLHRCLEKNPQRRWTARQLLHHSLFKK